jgi:TonB family protein
MGKRDIAHIAHGPVKYFLSFVKPPALSLPRKRAKDPMFAMLMAAAFVFYFAAIPAIYMSSDASEEVDEDDIWSIVNLPEKKEPPKPEVPKPKQKVAEVKTKPPTLKPPKPKPKPPKPVKPKEKPKPPKKVEKPKQKKPVTKPTKSLANARKKVPKPKPSRSRSKGMVSTGAKKPDFKAPGKDRGGPKGLAGGPRGGGKVRRNAGGARKGKSKADVRGVEGGAAGKASGVNLKKLGLGAGKILGKAGAGAVKTDFRNSAGGAGGGSGSASKTYGLGGPGKGRSLGVSGTGGAANNFGGYGGDGSGANGLGGAGIGKGFGRKGGGQGRAEVVVPPGDPVISGGLTMQEVHAVIRANLNQIRHCYNQLLQRSPNSSGKIKVNFKVNASGRVAGVSIMQSSINDSIMKSCVTGKIRRWKFPKPRGGQSVTVNYPFVFNPL